MQILERAMDPEARFTADECRAVQVVVDAGVPAPVLPTDQQFHQSMAALRASLPAKGASHESGQLQAKVYQKKLGHLPKGALDYACNRALEELRWFPTISELLAFARDWVSPEERAYNLARRALRQREDEARAASPPLTQAEVDRIPAHWIPLGVASGAIEPDGQGGYRPTEVK
jgi:hypothetical protein